MQEKMYVCNMYRKNSCVFYQIFYSIQQTKWASMNIDCLTNVQYEKVVDYLASKYSSKNMLV